MTEPRCYCNSVGHDISRHPVEGCLVASCECQRGVPAITVEQHLREDNVGLYGRIEDLEATLDRVRAELEAWKQTEKNNREGYLDDVARLDAELARLRGALQQIIDSPLTGNKVIAIARAALAASPTPND